MGAVNWPTFLKHPLEFKTFVQFYVYYHRKLRNSASGWDRPTMRKCWGLLGMTDVAYCAATKQLDGVLARIVALFYLAIRALDTIEDDITIPSDVKQPILRSFHIHTVTPGWTFNGCGPNETDRQLLVEYGIVVEEINLLSPQYKNIIVNVMLKAGTSMADYAHKAATSGSIYIETIAEYDQYCHYIGGIFIEGVSQIFCASGKESPSIGTQLELSNSVGLLLHKKDIVGDYREDLDQQRPRWPREIWGREEYGFKEMTKMYNTDPDTLRRATYVQSEMVLDAMKHVTDSLDYLQLLRTESIFNCVAISLVIAFAHLELFFMNKEVFQRKVEIRKAEAAKLIMRSTNMKEVALIFSEYARKIRVRVIPSDPNFAQISIVCGKIEQYCLEKF